MQAVDLPVPARDVIRKIRNYIRYVRETAHLHDWDRREEFARWCAWTTVAGEMLIDRIILNPEAPIIVVEKTINEMDKYSAEGDEDVRWFHSFVRDQMLDMYDHIFC